MSEAPTNHPALDKLRELAASLPEAKEVLTWGHPTFRAGEKIFATFEEHEQKPSISVKQTLEDQSILLQNPGFFKAPYVGQHGWVGIWVDQVDWQMTEDLVEHSYRLVASKRMLEALDCG